MAEDNRGSTPSFEYDDDQSWKTFARELNPPASESSTVSDWSLLPRASSAPAALQPDLDDPFAGYPLLNMPVVSEDIYLMMLAERERKEKEQHDAVMKLISRKIQAMKLDIGTKTPAGEMLSKYGDLVAVVRAYDAIKTPAPHDSLKPLIHPDVASQLHQMPRLQEKPNVKLVAENVEKANECIMRIKHELEFFSRYLTETEPLMEALYKEEKKKMAEEAEVEREEGCNPL